MSSSRNLLRPIVFVLCIGVTIAGLINVYADNSDVVAKAQTIACGSSDCAITMTSMGRTPISQSFTFQTRLTTSQQAASVVAVECQRQYVLVGDYECRRK
jgi:hypothetical protein